MVLCKGNRAGKNSNVHRPGKYRNTVSCVYGRNPLPHLEIFFKNAFRQKGYPLLGGRNHFWTGFRQRGHEQFSESKSPPTGGPTPRNRRGRKAQSRPAEPAGCIPRRHADRRGLMLVPGLAANHEAQPPLDLDCARKEYKLNSRQPAGKVYPHEIGIQETHTKHRKLDSQATLSHPSARSTG